MKAFVSIVLLGAAAVQAEVKLADLEPTVLDGKAAQQEGKPEQELVEELGLDSKAWGHELDEIWPDAECPNIGTSSPELTGKHSDLNECKENCLTKPLCNAINYHAFGDICVMRSCKAMNHPTNHNSWANPGWVGYRLKMDKPEIESELEALLKDSAKDTPAAEAAAVATVKAKEEAFDKKEAEEEEEATGDTAKEEAAKEEAVAEKEDAKEEAAMKEAAKKKEAAKEEAAKKEAAKKIAAAKEEAAKNEASEKAAAAKEEAAKKEAAKKIAAAKEEAAKKEAAIKAAAAKEKAAEQEAAKKKAEAAKKAAAIAAKAKAEAAAKKAPPPPFSYTDVGMFSTCQTKEAQTVVGKRKSFRSWDRFSIAPSLPEGIELNPKTGTISGTYKKEVKKGQKRVVKHLTFVVTAHGYSGTQTLSNLKMSLVEHHCSAQPPFLWLALAAVALVLLCVLCCFCGKEKSDKVPEKMPPPAYTELTPVTSRTDAKPAPAAPAAAPTQVKPAPAAARATPVAKGPAPTPAGASEPLLAGAEDEAIKTWTLKGAVIPKGQSARFTKDDALPGQIGSVKSFKLTPGLPLTFHTQTGEVLTVFALKKPLQVSYDACQPLKIEKVDGHGKELGIEAGWTLTGVGYEDISEMPYQAANDLLHEKVGQLPGAIPLTFKRNNGQVATTYAYHKPLGITFPKELPIKITEEKDGHGKEIGIKIGWELLAVNYKDIRGMRDFDAVNKLLHSEVDVLPTK